MSKFAFALVLGALLTAPLAGPASAVTYGITGMGADTCDNFLIDANDDSRVWRWVDWANGYMSAYNRERAVNGQEYLTRFGDSTIGENRSWYISYCSSNPSDSFADAAKARYMAYLRAATTS